MQPDLAGIDGRKKIGTKKRNQQHADCAERQKQRAEHQAVVQAPFEQDHISVAEILEAVLET